VAAEANAEVKELSNNEAGLKAELATLRVELEASRGIKPLEIAPAALSRNELLAQFNAEKDPRRAAEIFNQIKLAR
jgi:hypothetical protein